MPDEPGKSNALPRRLQDIRLSDSEQMELAKPRADSLTRKEHLENRDLEQNIEMRPVYARKLYKMAKWWLVFILLFLVAKGVLAALDISFLSDVVAVALIGTTTVNVIGLFAVVVKYLFYHPGK